MSDPVELLFFDTFSHDNSEELNLDLVQFPKPVFISEVRVIPLGARVQADFPGGVRLGATNPSQFSIEFFVNDLGKPGASTFESLGGLEYNQNGCIHLECSVNETTKRQIPTDGLVLRGWYTTITLAVYGTLTRVITEPIANTTAPPVIPPQPNVIQTDVQQQILTTNNTTETPWTNTDAPAAQIDYNAQVPVVYGAPQTNYPQTDVYPQEYTDYYSDETPKDPRSYHHDATEWDKSRTDTRNETTTTSHSRRERVYSRSRSRDRDYRENSRESDYETRVRSDRAGSIEYRDRYKDVYKRSRDRSYDRDERKRPRTPPTTKRPRTPHQDVKDLSPGDVESISEEEIGGALENEPTKSGKDSLASPLSKASDETKRAPTEELKLTPVNSPNTQHNDDVEEFEPILSDEDICDEGEQFQDLDYDYSEYVNNDDLIKLFNPFNADSQHYSKPSLLTEIKDFFILKPDDEDVTNMETNISDKINTFFTEKGARFNELYNLLQDINVDMIQYFNSDNSGDIREEWVQLCDQIPSLLENNDVIHFIINLYLYLSKRSNCEDTKFIENNSKYKQGKFVLITLLDWVKIGLNFDYALSQIQPGFKIRHIKSGIRLADALCEANGTELLVKQEFDIQQLLIELYHKEYMALSIKLMILKALDSTLWSRHGLEYFLNTERDFQGEKLNGYQIIIKMLTNNPLVRVKFALNSILSKLNMFEVLKNMKSIVSDWLSEKYFESEYCCNTIPEKQIDNLSFLLNNISKNVRFNAFTMTQPKRFLPVSAQFEIHRSANIKNYCHILFEMANFLENCLILLTHRMCNTMTRITSSILDILEEMLNNQQGLRYLSDNIETSNVIIRCLLHSSNSEDDAQYSRAQLIGLELSYKLQALYHIDFLLNTSKKVGYDYDSSDILDQLHSFYCLTFSNVGKTAVADVLSYSNNLNCLTQFFSIITFDSKLDKDDTMMKKLKKSPGIAYIVDLIGIVLIFATNASYLETYGHRLLKIANNYEYFEPTTCAKLHEIRAYLKPFETKNAFSYEDISPLCEIIKNSIANVSKLPEELVTCLRILVHLGIAPNCDDTDVQVDYNELKYKYVILQLYSLDGVSNLATILQKVCETFEQPYVHTAQFATLQGAIIVNIIQPCVTLIRRMLTNVIAVRNMQFKDLTTIPVLLQTFTLLNAFPSTSILYQRSCQASQEVIETLLAYTQPVSEEVNENDSLNKSLWTLMISEILKFITSAPFTFIPGLLVFSEMLPLPFPILTKLPLTEQEITRAVNLRKLWSAHLHSQSTNIQDLINTLMASSYQPLLHLLRRVCIQLSNLAANSALMICRGILENAFSALNPAENTAMEPCNGHTARILNFLASLLTHGAIKCAVMFLLGANSTTIKGDEKFPQLISLFCDVLRIQSELSSHIQAQECVISVIQSLCDSEITLYNNIECKPELTSDLYLSNALPPRDMLQVFITTMLDHIMAPECSYTTILPILRTFVLLTEHDYGFYHLQLCIEKKSKVFFNVFTKFIQNFSKDNADCLATMSAMLEFLRICLSTECMEIEPDIMFTPRSSTMSIAVIASSLSWPAVKSENSDEEPPKHPIIVLEKILQECSSSDDGLESLTNNLTNFLKSLNSIQSSGEKQELISTNEPILPPSENLLTQFSGRAIYNVTNDVTDERMSAAYWLSAPSDENDGDQEQIPCDLSEMCRQLLPTDVNLCRETDRICHISPCTDPINSDQLKIKRNTLEQHRYMTTADKLKRPFITPMRGRGFLRTPPQRGDPFRSRPPNTSRPPSLHVDDFVALETCGAQPTGPTGYNKLSREIMSVRGTTRGRGRAFISAEPASHFRHIGRGTAIWPGAHLTESVVSSLPQHFRVATETATHFSTVRTASVRGRGIPRLREAVPLVRHVRTIP